MNSDDTKCFSGITNL